MVLVFGSDSNGCGNIFLPSYSNLLIAKAFVGNGYSLVPDVLVVEYFLSITMASNANWLQAW